MKIESFVLSLLAHAVSCGVFKQYDDRWISADTLVAMLHAHFKINPRASFTTEHLNLALSQRNLTMLLRTKPVSLHNICDFTGGNPSNLYCVTDRHNGKRSIVFNIYHKEESKDDESNDDESNQQPPKKRTRRSRRTEVPRKNNGRTLLEEPRTSSRAFYELVLRNDSVVIEMLAKSNDCVVLPTDIKAMHDEIVEASTMHFSPDTIAIAKKRASPGKDENGNISNFFFSPEACSLFQPDPNVHQSAHHCLLEYIDKLKDARMTAGGYRDLIEGATVNTTYDELNMSEYETNVLKAKIHCLQLAYMMAIKHMGRISKEVDPLYKTWRECCQDVAGNDFICGASGYPSSGRSIERWNIEFRKNKCFLRNGHPTKKNKLPPILLDNPNVCKAMKEWVCSNLDGLNTEKVHGWVHDVMIPKMIGDSLKVGESKTKTEFLKYYGLKVVSHPTVLRWMHALGMRYCAKRANYYVDGHEREDNIIYRWKYVRRYLKDEYQQHRWVQMTVQESVEIKNTCEDKDITFGPGWRYSSPDGTEMVEYHVDAIHQCQNEIMKRKLIKTPYGGNVSVRRDMSKKILISFGHDEAIFRKNAFSSRSWRGASGETVIRPKGEGEGVMISAIQSRDFGFGFPPLTISELNRINSKRRGTKYIDIEAAIEIHGSAEKSDLKVHPFVQEFKYGANKDGYWSYEHLVCQLEDCQDVMKTLYPEFNVKYNVDHSCGHDRQRPDSLNVHRMNVEYGGNQNKCHDSIMSKDTLGVHSPSLAIGDIQTFTWKCSDLGPMDMSPTEREALRNGDLTTTKFRPLKKADMIKGLKALQSNGAPVVWKETVVEFVGSSNIKSNGINLGMKEIRKLCRSYNVDWRSEGPNAVRQKTEVCTIQELLAKLKAKNLPIPERYVKKTLIDLAKAHNISTDIIRTTGITKSWVGQPKGMMDIAFERGLMDLETYCVEDFSKLGTKTALQVVNMKTSLQNLLEKCADFIDEETLLQSTVRKMGAILDRSPKYHCEIAGEGIEYSWGNAKMRYRRVPFSGKKSSEQFYSCVRDCLSRDYLDINRVRKNSRRAREYMAAYFVQSQNVDIDNCDDDGDGLQKNHTLLDDVKPSAISAQKIEQMRLMFRTHRAAFDFDHEFCKCEVVLVKVKLEKL